MPNGTEDNASPYWASPSEMSRVLSFPPVSPTNPKIQAIAQALRGAASSAVEIPQHAFEASENMRLGGDYNPGPILSAAALAGTGGLAAPVKTLANEAALGAGPIRAYHGSTTLEGKFSPEFTHELGPHFGATVEQANHRLGPRWDPQENKVLEFARGSRIIPVDIHTNNPLQLRDPGAWRPHELLDQLSGKGYGAKELEPAEILASRYYNVPTKDGLNKALSSIVDLLKGRGYDAIKYQNKHEGDITSPNNLAYIPLRRGIVQSALTRKTLYGLPALPAAAQYFGQNQSNQQ